MKWVARYAYANTPDKKVEANVKALSACVNSPYRGGPAGWASTFPFENRRPAPRLSFFFLWTDAGTGDLAADWPVRALGFAAALVASLAGGLTAGDFVAAVGFFVAGGIFGGIERHKHGRSNVKHEASGRPATARRQCQCRLGPTARDQDGRSTCGRPWSVGAEMTSACGVVQPCAKARYGPFYVSFVRSLLAA